MNNIGHLINLIKSGAPPQEVMAQTNDEEFLQLMKIVQTEKEVTKTLGIEQDQATCASLMQMHFSGNYFRGKSIYEFKRSPEEIYSSAEDRHVLKQLAESVVLDPKMMVVDVWSFALQKGVNDLVGRLKKAQGIDRIRFRSGLEKLPSIMTKFLGEFYLYGMVVCSGEKSEMLLKEQNGRWFVPTSKRLDRGAYEINKLIRILSAVLPIIEVKEKNKQVEERWNQEREICLQSLNSLKELITFGERRRSSVENLRTLLDMKWNDVTKGAQDLSNQNLAVEELFLMISFWDERFTKLCDEGLFSINAKEAFKKLKSLQKEVWVHGKLSKTGVIAFEEFLIKQSVFFTQHFEETSYDFMSAKKNKLTHSQWLAKEGIQKGSLKKTQEQFIVQLGASETHFSLISQVIEDLFRHFETQVVCNPTRFTKNPSAAKFCKKIGEGMTCVNQKREKHEFPLKSVTESAIPKSVSLFKLDQWVTECHKIHQDRLNSLFHLQKRGKVDFSPLGSICTLALLDEIEGLTWYRQKLILNDLKKYLLDWAKQWKEETVKAERLFRKGLKKLRGEEKKQAIEEVCLWMDEQKRAQRAVFDVLCIGSWVDHLVFDAFKLVGDVTDCSCFFPKDLRYVLESFEPEEYLDRGYDVAQVEPASQVRLSVMKSSIEEPVAAKGLKKKTRPENVPQSPELPEERVITNQNESSRDVPWKGGMKVRKLLKELYGLGFAPKSQKGSHLKLQFEDQSVIVPVAQSELREGTLRSIAAQAGVLKPD